MRTHSFRYCMLIGAFALAGVSLYYFFSYLFVVSVALDNNHLEPMLDHSIRAQWLAFACQSLLIALLYAVVAFRPHSVSREVIVLLGLLQLIECVLLFVFAESQVAAWLLIVAAVFVMVGSVLWPRRLVASATPAPAAAAPGSYTSAPTPPPRL